MHDAFALDSSIDVEDQVADVVIEAQTALRAVRFLCNPTITTVETGVLALEDLVPV